VLDIIDQNMSLAVSRDRGLVPSLTGLNRTGKAILVVVDLRGVFQPLAQVGKGDTALRVAFELVRQRP